MTSHKSIFKILVSVSGIVMVAKILGFLKQVVTANAFGATLQTDLISLSQGLVTDIDYVLIQALMTAFVPIYIGIKINDEKAAMHFVSNVLKAFFIITLLITAGIIVFSNRISHMIAPSYTTAVAQQLAKYIVVMAPALILIVLLAVFNALLKANEHFLPGEFISVNQSVVLVVLVYSIGHMIGADTLVVSFYAYAVTSLLFLAYLSKHYIGSFYGNPFVDNNVHRLLNMMLPLLIGYSMVFINQQIGKIIVTEFGEGTITAMTFGATLSNFVSTFVGSICGVLFTFVSKSIAEKNDLSAAEMTIQSLVHLTTITLPICILTVCNATDIVTIVFKRGAFDAQAVINSAAALKGYAFMFIPFIARELFSRLQYAYGDSKQPMINSTVSIVFNIIFSVTLGRIYGILGVALASSISVLICAALNIYSASGKNRHLHISGIARVLPNWIFGAILCFIIIFVGQQFLAEQNVFIRFSLICLITFLIYGISVYSIIKPFIIRIRRR